MIIKQCTFLFLGILALPVMADKSISERSTGSTPQYEYNNVHSQDLSASAYLNGVIYLGADGGKNSNFPEVRQTTLNELDNPAKILVRKLVQRDIEGATQLGDEIYITSSLSQVNEDTGDYRVLSAFNIDEKGDVDSERYVYARDLILNGLKAHFGDNAWFRRVSVSFGKTGGLNVEGLTASHNNPQSVIMGLRSPLWHESFGSPKLEPTLSLNKGDAILVEISKPFSALPELTVKTIDLAGQGIRGIEYIPALKGYVVISGSVQKMNLYSLWFYEPISGETRLLSKNNDSFSQLCRPESILNIPNTSIFYVLSEESGTACTNSKFNYVSYDYK